MATSRAMFWRILRRQVFANRGRLFVVLLALAAGAAITAALLNLQVDAKQRLTTEFKSFGSNVIVTPRNSTGVLDESLYSRIPNSNDSGPIAKAEFLYGVVEVSLAPSGERNPNEQKGIPVILVGYIHSGVGAEALLAPGLTEAEEKSKFVSSLQCGVGQKVAERLQLALGGGLSLRSGNRQIWCGVEILPSTGGAEDSQIFFGLVETQKLLAQTHKVSVIQLRVPGNSNQIERFLADVAPSLGDAEGRPLRQFSDAQGKIYGKISGLLTATVVFVLILTALCVMAAMTNVAMERRNDVGLMKAIGGATRRVLRLFLTEAALLGLVGGLIGAAVGILLSIGLGKAVFGVAARPRLIVYPVAVGLTIIVAIASSYPLRRLASIRPASVFRGEA
ncbi:MAG: ABC transporter permease [Candidatus Acidiferrum sp.]|jgi:putative ABC transport system permease protein